MGWGGHGPLGLTFYCTFQFHCYLAAWANTPAPLSLPHLQDPRYTTRYNVVSIGFTYRFIVSVMFAGSKDVTHKFTIWREWGGGGGGRKWVVGSKNWWVVGSWLKKNR